MGTILTTSILTLRNCFYFPAAALPAGVRSQTPVPPSSSQFAVPQVPPTGGQVPPPLAAEDVSPGRHNIFIN